MSEPKKQTGILWKLTAEEKEALREVCDWAKIGAEHSATGPSAPLKLIRQLIGEETE